MTAGLCIALAVLLLAGGNCRASVSSDVYDKLLTKAQENSASAFQEFARLHSKPYLDDREEYARRQAVFEANLARIVAHNAANSASYALGLNPHADMTTEEFRRMYLGEKPTDMRKLRAAAAAAGNEAPADPFPFTSEVPPPRKNWVEEGIITPVKNQHPNNMPCGCCYAFGGIAGIEAANALYTGRQTTLSEQEIVDCDMLDFGCDGGDFKNVFRWVRENGGVASDADWPYAAKESGHCPNKKMLRDKVVTINGQVDVPGSNETALMQAVAHTPTVVAVCCGQYLDAWHLYKSGIMDESTQCVEPLDHAVLVAGYDTDPATGTDYWLIKNSWGQEWGDGGYLRLKRNVADPEGQAGLATMPGYATKTKPNPGQEGRRMGMRGSVQALSDWWEGMTAWLGSY